ncbi:disulfide oxidoreductase [Paenibacillus sp. GCM10027629]|uniref:disulfide oxidoreductase n=1 Tax=Paenibacillus sp. GCM10027629 TaxID=3273414 RepID=UPI00362FCBA2
MRQWMLKYGLYVAWLISIIATVGSLYMSEVLLYEPCRLCWFQRILMYPLVIILGIAAYEHNTRITRYALPLVLIGGSISTWHILEQKIPGFAQLAPCKVGIPCNFDYLNWFGFITIPMLALTAFVLIAVVLIIIGRGAQDQASDH